MVIARTCPPWVRQSLVDSCWAAVLEAWARVDPRLPTFRQQPLIDEHGEPTTGGLNPEAEIPLIAGPNGLVHKVRTSGQAIHYIRSYLRQSHIFVCYSVPGYMHSVLVYRLRDNDVSFMDPYDVQYKNRPHRWLETKGPFVFIRKP